MYGHQKSVHHELQCFVELESIQQHLTHFIYLSVVVDYKHSNLTTTKPHWGMYVCLHWMRKFRFSFSWALHSVPSSVFCFSFWSSSPIKLFILLEKVFIIVAKQKEQIYDSNNCPPNFDGKVSKNEIQTQSCYANTQLVEIFVKIHKIVVHSLSMHTMKWHAFGMDWRG